jgi:hypothetical protein
MYPEKEREVLTPQFSHVSVPMANVDVPVTDTGPDSQSPRIL